MTKIKVKHIQLFSKYFWLWLWLYRTDSFEDQ